MLHIKKLVFNFDPFYLSFYIYFIYFILMKKSVCGFRALNLKFEIMNEKNKILKLQHKSVNRSPT
jgi:hypothetical protein